MSPEETNTIPASPSPTPAEVTPSTSAKAPAVAEAMADKTADVPLVAPAPVAPVVPPSSDGASRPTSEPLPAPSNDGVRSLLSKALAKIQFRKRAKLEKIMVLAKSTRRFGGRMPRPRDISQNWSKPADCALKAAPAAGTTCQYSSRLKWWN